MCPIIRLTKSLEIKVKQAVLDGLIVALINVRELVELRTHVTEQQKSKLLTK